MNDETPLNLSAAEPYATYDGDDDLDARARKRRRRWIIAAVVLALALVAWFMMRSGGEEAPADAREGQVPTVTVIAPGRGTIQGTITATGTLAARRELPVGSVGEGGQIVRVMVDAGDWVGQGQVLAVIDRSVQTQQAASLGAQIQVSQADANLAQANLDRAMKLVDRGFISKADVDRLTATRDAANARVRVARAQLGEAQARTARLNIVAPAAGLVLERNAEPGQVVGGASGVLFRLAQGGEMELRAAVSEADLAQLAPGVAATVTPVGTDKAFTGQVWQLSPVINPQSRQGTAKIALAYSPELRPGGFASATIASGTVVAPVLPESAILSDEKGSFVYIVGPDSKAVRRAVKTGIVTERGIAVIEGLNGTERVVLRAGGFLAPGDKVVAKLAKSAG
ncbi:MAG TPA: efflux RND transporter periplasmic adaptor subunit [Novosphingobium sp.]|nr:efflux RND transporter periplasmic adaptor subunit [Novosphingobium sp.]